jgi:hydroxyacylglutathione hydrolase
MNTNPVHSYILCGHEYTASNLEFVHWLEPDNKAIAQKLQYAKQRRQYLYPVIPTTLDEERQINSFLRVREPSVAKRVEELAGNIQGQGKEREIQLIGAIRSLKDNNAHKKSSL